MSVPESLQDIKDSDGLAAECGRVKDMGFKEKLCIHPGQLETVNRELNPGPKEIEAARKIVEAAEGQGRGAIVVDGKMVDMPVITAARCVLAMAEKLER